MKLEIIAGPDENHLVGSLRFFNRSGPIPEAQLQFSLAKHNNPTITVITGISCNGKPSVWIIQGSVINSKNSLRDFTGIYNTETRKGHLNFK